MRGNIECMHAAELFSPSDIKPQFLSIYTLYMTKL